MGGIGLGCLQPQPNTTHTYAHIHTQSHIHISAYHAQQSCTCIEYRTHNTPQQHIYMHTICTKFAHTQDTENTEQTNKTICSTYRTTPGTTQNTPDTTDTEQTQHSTQPQHMCTYDLHTYSFDLYHEYAYINNSNTIELYTISKEII